jgi:hypothetical protein
VLAEPAIFVVEPNLRFVEAERDDLARVRLEDAIDILDAKAFVDREPF